MDELGGCPISGGTSVAFAERLPMNPPGPADIDGPSLEG